MSGSADCVSCIWSTFEEVSGDVELAGADEVGMSVDSDSASFITLCSSWA